MTETNVRRRIALAPLLIGLAVGATLAACARSAYESGREHRAAAPAVTAHRGSDADHAGHAHDADHAGHEEHAGHDTDAARPAEHAGHDRDGGGDHPAGHDAGATHEVPGSTAQPGAAATVPADVQIDLGNTACPTMGGDVNGKTFTVWRNLRVGHCCPGCSEDFLAAPEARLDEVSPGWRKALEAVESINSARGAQRDRLIATLGERFTIVRPAGGGR